MGESLDFIKRAIDFIYAEAVAIPRDVIMEYNLRSYKTKKGKKKILGVWDFNQEFGKKGDFTIFLEVLSCLQHELLGKGKKTDLVFLNNNSHHNAKRPQYNRGFRWKKQLKDLAIVCPEIDTIMEFSSNKEFTSFFQHNNKKYFRWPTTVTGTVTCDNRIVDKFYKKHNYIPKQIMPKDLLDDIEDFFKKKVYPAKPIVIHMRNNPNHSKVRNTRIGEIKKFLKHHEKNKKYKFIIVGTVEEIPKDFLSLKNVLFSKHYFTSIEHDYALVNKSHISILASSGLLPFAWNARIPFIMYGSHVMNRYTAPKNNSYSFFLPTQKYYAKKAGPWLIPAFENLTRILEK